MSQMEQKNNALYFPPPPGYPSTDADSKSSRPSKKSSSMKINMSSRPRKQGGLRHTIGHSSASRKRRIKELHLPDIKLSPRHWTLVSLLLVSFLTLILGFIFADCVALPHTNKEDSATGVEIPDSVTLYVRRIAAASVSSRDTPQSLDTPSNFPSNITLDDDNSGSGDATLQNGNSTTPAEYEASEAKKLGFDSTKNLAILFFYTATLPLLTMLHTIVELAFLCYAKRQTSPTTDEEASDDGTDSLSKLRPLSLAQKHRTNSNTPPTTTITKLNTLLRFLPALSLSASILLICGWITMNAIQLHCEIAVSSPSQLQTQMICPIQIRGHSMQGIHELSIVKNVFGWVLVVMYVGYAAWCVRVNKLVWTAARGERRARQNSDDIRGMRQDQLRRSVIRFAVQEDEEVVEERKKGALVSVNTV